MIKKERTRGGKERGKLCRKCKVAAKCTENFIWKKRK
jgi:hypothetical protein